MKTKNIKPSNGRTLKPQRQNSRVANAPYPVLVVREHENEFVSL